MSETVETNIQETKPESRFYVVNKITTLKGNIIDKLKNYKQTIIQPTKETFEEIRTGLKHDYELLKEEFSKKTDKFVPKTTFIKDAKEKLSEKLCAIKEKINLPTKTDVEKLKSSMEALSQKVELLNQKNPA